MKSLHLKLLEARLDDPNLSFEIKADMQNRVNQIERQSAPAPNPPPPRPPSPKDLEPPKLPPLDSGDVEPSFRISIGPTPELEHYLNLGYRVVAITPPRPPSPKDDEPQRLQVATLDKAAPPPLPPLEVDPADPGSPQGVPVRIARREKLLEWHRKRNGLPPALPPLKISPDKTPEDVKARVEDHLARYRRRNGLPPARPPLKRPKQPN